MIFLSNAFSFFAGRRESRTYMASRWTATDAVRIAECDLWKKPPLFCFLPAAPSAVNFFRAIFLRRRRGKYCRCVCVYGAYFDIHARCIISLSQFHSLRLARKSIKMSPRWRTQADVRKGNVRRLLLALARSPLTSTITTLFLSAPIPTPRANRNSGVVCEQTGEEELNC